ncbi:uncharacterized protein TrAFT101_010565 [Trichoderma asperellum]|uniref:uncharacterized protein n=1 Tax=Trichoderma asperellum TaxID=101201 RepID=UPI0033175BFB|nr:hypothetical protein TrAFT101_010565 [Trichoderma asperellum]
MAPDQSISILSQIVTHSDLESLRLLYDSYIGTKKDSTDSELQHRIQHQHRDTPETKAVPILAHIHHYNPAGML